MQQRRDPYLHIFQALRDMQAETNLGKRLRIAARTLRDLGWAQAVFSLYDERLTIVEPESDTANQVTIPEDIWQNGRIQKMEPNRIGSGYYVPRDALTNRDNSAPLARLTSREWRAGDRMYIPIRMEGERLAGVVSLDGPRNNRRPTEDEMRPVDILISQARTLIENSRLQQTLTETTQKSHGQIEELVTMQRVDEELGATLNFDNVMMLTMDWAIRRTGAAAGMLNMVTADGDTLIPVAALGYPIHVLKEQSNNPTTFETGIVGRAARTKAIQIVKEVQRDPDYWPLLDTTKAEIAIPLEMRGRLLGVINLESDDLETFDRIDLGFLQRLGSRAAVALDNARLYREAEQRADEMAALYSASRAISSSLERSEVLTNAAQALAAVLGVSSILMADYQSDRHQLSIAASYRLGTARKSQDVLPGIGEVFDLERLLTIDNVIRTRRAEIVQATDPALTPDMRLFLVERRFQSMLVTPLSVQDQVFGVAMLIEGRRERQFKADEVLMAEALASQTASALRQAKLYEDVRELEKLKSEMIRMASHDLRNPLGNAIGYLELLLMGLNDVLRPQQLEFVANIRRSTNTMKSLIDDLLTLERVESERQTAWSEINMSVLTDDVVEAQQQTADLKHHQLSSKIDDGNLWVRGNATQLRQAMTNLVGNGIKYTADKGQVQIRLFKDGKRLVFEVEDNGYGISPDKQKELFQRFYRAHEPGTDHIPGTGLGLSLVKTVIERHGGEVSVKSAIGAGSTFTFWLPAIDAPA